MVLYLRAANIKDGELDLKDIKAMNFDPREQVTFALRRGDVLVSEGAGSLTAVGTSAVWQEEMSGTVCFQNTLLRLRPKAGSDERFLGWWARHAYYAGLFAAIAGGANIFHLSAERVRSLPCWMPSLETQRKVADYLDAETSRIDGLMAKKRRMIELLSDRFKALLMETLFGRDEHWIALSRVCQCLPGYSFPSEQMLPTSDGNVRLLRGINVAVGETRWESVAYYGLPYEHSLSAYELRDGDLVIGMDRPLIGGGMRVATISLPDLPCLLVQRVARLRAGHLTGNAYLRYLLTSDAFIAHFAPIVTGVSVPHISADQILSFRFPLPALSEQVELVGVLRRAEDLLRAGANALDSQIELLIEHRQALITDAVTGEIDIPELAA